MAQKESKIEKISKRTKNPTDLLRGYCIGIEDGKREALQELQKNNRNTDLPSNETLHKIFGLLFEYMGNNRSSVHMNQYDVYARYITENWNK